MQVKGTDLTSGITLVQDRVSFQEMGFLDSHGRKSRIRPKDMKTLLDRRDYFIGKSVYIYASRKQRS